MNYDGVGTIKSDLTFYQKIVSSCSIFLRIVLKEHFKESPVNSVWCGKPFYCAVSLAVFKVVGKKAGTIIAKNKAALLIDRISLFNRCCATPPVQMAFLHRIFPWSYSRWINHPSTRFLKTVGLLLVLYQEKHLVAAAMLCRSTIATECIYDSPIYQEISWHSVLTKQWSLSVSFAMCKKFERKMIYFHFTQQRIVLFRCAVKASWLEMS